MVDLPRIRLLLPTWGFAGRIDVWTSTLRAGLQAPCFITLTANSEAGGRDSAFERSSADRARVTICFRSVTRLAPASVAHQNTEPDRTISLYRFFGMLHITSAGFLSLSIWTSYFRLGVCAAEEKQ